MKRPFLRQIDIDRFWAKVDKEGPVPSHLPHLGACWIWTAATFDGYGIVKIDGLTVRSHRLSFMLHHGAYPIKHALHRCDNRACVRPDHLRDGDDRDNATDRETRGRGNHARGSNNGRSVVDEDTARQILSLRGQISQRKLARELGVKRSLVSDIHLGRCWRHL